MGSPLPRRPSLARSPFPPPATALRCVATHVGTSPPFHTSYTPSWRLFPSPSQVSSTHPHSSPQRSPASTTGPFAPSALPPRPSSGQGHPCAWPPPTHLAPQGDTAQTPATYYSRYATTTTYRLGQTLRARRSRFLVIVEHSSDPSRQVCDCGRPLYLLTYLLTHLLTHSLTCLPANLLTYLLTN